MEKQAHSEVAHNGIDEQVSRVVDHLLDRVGTNLAFGEPVRSGETTVIPVAEVRSGFGLGFGRGKAGKGAADEVQEGGGGGTGGSVRVTPTGYIKIQQQEVRFEPILNFTRIILTCMVLSAFVTWVVADLLRED